MTHTDYAINMAECLLGVVKKVKNKSPKIYGTIQKTTTVDNERRKKADLEQIYNKTNIKYI